MKNSHYNKMKAIFRWYKYLFPRKHKDNAFRVARFGLTSRFSLLLLVIGLIPMFITAWHIEAGSLMPGENFYFAIPFFLLILIVPCARLLSNWVINRDIKTINRFCLEIKKGNYNIHFDLGTEKEEEEPFIVLLRNLTWLSHSLNSRQEKSRSRLEDIRNKHRDMQEKALTDGLTGLYNRRHFEMVLPEMIDRAVGAKTVISLIFIDCDKFKHLNDTLGHHMGDMALEILASSIRSCIRTERDIPFRFGGDEFAVLLQGVNIDRAVDIADRIRLLFLDNRIGEVTLSLGVATTLPDEGVSNGWLMKKLIRIADQQTYLAKKNGGNNVCSVSDMFIVDRNSMIEDL